MAENVMGWNGPIAVTLTQGQAATEVSRVRLDTYKPEGFFSLQGAVGTSGATTISYELSNAPVGTPEANIQWNAAVTDIVTGETSGTFFKQFPLAGEIGLGKQMRIMAAETTTSGAHTTSITLWPNMQ